VAIAAKALNPNICIIGAEPEGAADAQRSKTSGRLQDHNSPPQTIADGLKTILGVETWPAIRDLVDEIITVSDFEIMEAMKMIHENLGVVVEPSGAIGVAVAHSARLKDFEELENIGVIVSGGNIELGHFNQLIGSHIQCSIQNNAMEESDDLESGYTDVETSSVAESEGSSGEEMMRWC